MPSGPIVKDRQIPGTSGTGEGKIADSGSIVYLVEDPTKKYHIPVFGSISPTSKKVDYDLVTASVTVEVNGVQIKKEMRVALPKGEIAKDLKASLKSLDVKKSAKPKPKVKKAPAAKSK